MALPAMAGKDVSFVAVSRRLKILNISGEKIIVLFKWLHKISPIAMITFLFPLPLFDWNHLTLPQAHSSFIFFSKFSWLNVLLIWPDCLDLGLLFAFPVFILKFNPPFRVFFTWHFLSFVLFWSPWFGPPVLYESVSLDVGCNLSAFHLDFSGILTILFQLPLKQVSPLTFIIYCDDASFGTFKCSLIPWVKENSGGGRDLICFTRTMYPFFFLDLIAKVNVFMIRQPVKVRIYFVEEVKLCKWGGEKWGGD